MGYDDSSAIADIRELMRENPALSRRAAIIQIAGEGSLRRIEVKMKALNNDTGEKSDDLIPAITEWLKTRRLSKVEASDLHAIEGTVSSISGNGAFIEVIGSGVKVIPEDFTRFAQVGDRVRKYMYGGQLVLAQNLDQGTRWSALDRFDQKGAIGIICAALAIFSPIVQGLHFPDQPWGSVPFILAGAVIYACVITNRISLKGKLGL